MEEKKLSNAESLQLIEQMIGRAKQEEKQNGLGWIIWGWMLFLASFSHYILLVMGIEGGMIIWNVFGIAAIVLMAYNLYRENIAKSADPVKTYTGELVSKIGNAFFISLLILVVGNYTTNADRSGVNFGYLLLLYAFWMYIHGAAFRFNLLKYGAFLNWIGALVIFLWYRELGRHTLLIHAVCVLAGYIIPGYIAQKRFGKRIS
jgi:hypothetical protein